MTTTISRDSSIPLTEKLSAELLNRLGSRVNSTTGERAGVEEVLTGVPFTDLPVSSVDDVDAVIAVARAAQTGWAATPYRKRAAVIRKFTSLLRAETDTMLDLLQAETGKSRWDAFIELLEPSLTLGYYVREGASILRDHSREPMMPMFVDTVEVRHPKGVVGVVAPWNFPLAIGISDAVTAVIAGNAVVLKPCTQTALSSLFAAELLERAGLPEGVFQVVIGRGTVVGSALIDRADYIAFTGSSDTGTTVARQSADRLIGCTLELGGKNSMIVLDDADLDTAAAGAVRGCFFHAGQVCMAIEKILVPASQLDEFVRAFATATADIDYATTYTYDGKMGSLTNRQQLETVVRYVDDAISKGANIVAGGRARPDIGPYFYEPTILTGVTPDMALYSEEVFGPVVAIYGYDTEADAIALANDGEYGLHASIFTSDTKRARDLGRSIRAGTVNINEGLAAAYGSMGAPAGGMGKSGLGRRHGTEGILKYTDAQTISIQRAALQAPFDWVPRKPYESAFNLGFSILSALRIR